MHGHPVAELVPLQREQVGPRTFVPLGEIQEGLRGIMSADQAREWWEEIRALRKQGGPALDAWEKYEKLREEGKLGPPEEK